MVSEKVRKRIFETVRREPSLVRREVRARSAWAIAFSAAAPAVTFLVVASVRRGQRPWSLFATTTVGTLVIALVAAWIAVCGKRLVVGRARVTLLSTAIVVPVLFTTWKLASSAMYEGTMSLD